MADQHGEKSQDPTPHRRQKAREEGQVARSQDLASAAALLAGTLALMASGTQLATFFARYARGQLGGEAWLQADVASTAAHCWAVLGELAWCVLPTLGFVVLAAAAVQLAQVGFLFLPSKLLPDADRVNPLRGFGRVFSAANAVRLVLGLFKLTAIAAVALVYLYGERGKILGLTALEPPEIAAYLTEVALWTTLKVGVALLVLALLDYGFQYWRHEQDLKMTPQEVREELKNLEGDPQIAARRKVVQRQLALHRLSQAVPKADVVVTNPTELAVAIQYQPESMAAPIVVAKGAGVVAQRIRRLAAEHGIPIVERKPLAQALYREVEINHPIPQEKYAAVAEVLAYVYHLKGQTAAATRARTPAT